MIYTGGAKRGFVTDVAPSGEREASRDEGRKGRT